MALYTEYCGFAMSERRGLGVQRPARTRVPDDGDRLLPVGEYPRWPGTPMSPGSVAANRSEEGGGHRSVHPSLAGSAPVDVHAMERAETPRASVSTSGCNALHATAIGEGVVAMSLNNAIFHELRATAITAIAKGDRGRRCLAMRRR